ncbi:MAG: TatD family hydrolase [Thermoguttaceae bacterium]|nr:TatD family hydrolase [Thermoguttaceae bacterium]
MTNEKHFSLFDTHCHLYLEGFREDQAEVIERSIQGVFPTVRGKDVGIAPGQFRLVAAIAPGIDAETSTKVVAMNREYPFLFPAVAIHPNYTLEAPNEDWETIKRLAALPNVVAMGETGLDLYRDYSPLDVQIDYFKRHLELAALLDLPVIIHCRDAQSQMLDVLHKVSGERKQNGHPFRGSIHSFAGDVDFARECLALGFHIGFTGSVTYTNKKGAPLWDAAKVIPPERLLIETDSPFLVPHPFRGKLERNEPLMVAFVAKRLAELRGVPTEEIIRQTTQNAVSLFGLNRYFADGSDKF